MNTNDCIRNIRTRCHSRDCHPPLQHLHNQCSHRQQSNTCCTVFTISNMFNLIYECVYLQKFFIHIYLIIFGLLFNIWGLCSAPTEPLDRWCNTKLLWRLSCDQTDSCRTNQTYLLCVIRSNVLAMMCDMVFMPAIIVSIVKLVMSFRP